MTTKSEPKTRKVRVNEQRSYVDEEPIVEEETIFEESVEPADPIGEFLRSIDSERQLTLQVFALPKFAQDGKFGSRSAERVFVTSFAFTSDEVETYRQRIQYCYPQGGMFSLEIRERGTIQKVWTEAISAAPGFKDSQTTAPFGFPPPPVINVNNPRPNGETVGTQKPFEGVKEAFSLLRDMGETMKAVLPQPAIIEQQSQNDANGNRPIEERLFEAIAIKALESDKVPVDRLIDALAGRRSEPGWMETLVPLGIEAMKLFAPTINALAQRAAQNAQVTQPAAGLTQPAQLGAAPSNEPQEPVAGQEQQPPPIVDPVQRDWFQAMIRLLEDCTRHVELASVGGGSKSVVPAAESVLELMERYPEQLGPTIQILLVASPEEVLDSCAMMLDERGQAHVNTVLKPQPAAAKWIEELQGECKRIISEASEQENEPDTDVA